MGLLQKACETYDRFSYLAGVEVEGQKTLAPISHLITFAPIEITLNQDGHFITARTVDKSEGKIIIPVTEASGGRVAAPCAHPLCDQLSYLATYNETKHNLYVKQLSKWTESPWNHPKLQAVLDYVRGGTILADLSQAGVVELDAHGIPKNEKALVRWIVNGLGLEASGPCWTDPSLFQSFIQYYAHVAATQNTNAQLCLISGEVTQPAQQHPKGIIPISGNAKLISANDSSNFTYRGRFKDSWQAATVGYVASQKAHNALRWIVANQGVRVAMPGDGAAFIPESRQTEKVVFGGRTFLCWDPQGHPLPYVTGGFGRRGPKTICVNPTQYREQLRQTLSGWKTNLPDDAGVVIAAFDAATSGRLALTYYGELLASDFLQRLRDWDETCCWENGNYGIQSPSLFHIANFAFGTPREGRFETDDRILRQQMQRLVSCRVDRARFPFDIEQRLVQAASKMHLYDRTLREHLLFTACAVIQKYHYDNDNNREVWTMETNLNTPDRSFQFGRLLAVLERTEQYYYWKANGNQQAAQAAEQGGKTERETNAIRMLSVYCQHPFHTYRILEEKLRTAYLRRLPASRTQQYQNRVGEIVEILMQFDEKQLDQPLKDTYLLGYYCQRKEMNQRKKPDVTTDANTTTEEDN